MVPRPRLEVAELLVLHLVELGVELDHVIVGVVVVGRDVVARPVAQRSPDDRDRLLAEQLAGVLDLGEVLHLEGDVMHLRLLAGEEIHRVVVRPAAQEREEVLDPVGHAEAEHLRIELGDLLGVVDDEGDVAELERADADHLVMLAEIAPLREQLDGRALRVLELQHLADARDRVVAQFVGNALVVQLPAHRGEVGIRRHFERQAGALRVRALVEPDDELTDLGREKGAARLALGEHQSVHLRVVVDGPIEIGGLERGVADSSCLDHGAFLLESSPIQLKTS